MSESLTRKSPCECWWNPETGYLEACSVHDPVFMDYAYTISEIRKQVASQAAMIQSMREALEKICTALFDARIGEAGMVAHAALAQVSASPVTK